MTKKKVRQAISRILSCPSLSLDRALGENECDQKSEMLAYVGFALRRAHKSGCGSIYFIECAILKILAKGEMPEPLYYEERMETAIHLFRTGTLRSVKRGTASAGLFECLESCGVNYFTSILVLVEVCRAADSAASVGVDPTPLFDALRWMAFLPTPNSHV